MTERNNIAKEVMVELEIPIKVYVFIVLIIVIYFLYKFFFSKEEIIEFLDKSKYQLLKDEDKLNLFTQFNTKINRDYLDFSNYYNEIGYSKIYGNGKNKNNCKDNKSKEIIIKKNKRVSFTQNIIYEN